MAKFEIYQDNGRQDRWRLRGNNHQIIATGGQGYVKKADCENGVKLLKFEFAATGKKSVCANMAEYLC